MIEVLKAAPYATVQDLGFPRGRSWGLPPSGAMDPLLLQCGNLAVGNVPGAAGIEWALGPLTVRFSQETKFAAAAVREVRMDDEPFGQSGLVATAPPGIPIALFPLPDTRFSYLALRGGIDVPMVLGSRSTYLPGGFGGHEGRRLRNGDRLETAGQETDRVRELDRRAVGSSDLGTEEVVLRVTRGPQWEQFPPSARVLFFSSRFTVDRASDRSGFRLAGPAVLPREAATLPSEAACPGAVQLPDNGQPIVLMPDGPTVGGYPKLAVVIRIDLRLLAQCQPGRPVRFREVTLEEARAGLRAETAELGALEAGEG